MKEKQKVRICTQCGGDGGGGGSAGGAKWCKGEEKGGVLGRGCVVGIKEGVCGLVR